MQKCTFFFFLIKLFLKNRKFSISLNINSIRYTLSAKVKKTFLMLNLLKLKNCNYAQ